MAFWSGLSARQGVSRCFGNFNSQIINLRGVICALLFSGFHTFPRSSHISPRYSWLWRGKKACSRILREQDFLPLHFKDKDALNTCIVWCKFLHELDRVHARTCIKISRASFVFRAFSLFFCDLISWRWHPSKNLRHNHVAILAGRISELAGLMKKDN